MENICQAAEEISLFCRLYMNIKKEIPIRSSEMGLLIYLVKSDNPKTPIEASKYFKVTKAMITNMVTALAKNGYVVKEKSDEDKRSCIICPTNKAVVLVNETYDEYFGILSKLQSGLSKEEFDRFIETLKKANKILLEEKNG